MQQVHLSICGHIEWGAMHTSHPWFGRTRTQIRRIYSGTCTPWLQHHQLRHDSWGSSNCDDVQLHLHSSCMFSHVVQMDSQTGRFANETIENQKYMFNHWVKIRERNMHPDWKNRTKCFKLKTASHWFQDADEVVWVSYFIRFILRCMHRMLFHLVAIASLFLFYFFIDVHDGVGVWLTLHCPRWFGCVLILYDDVGLFIYYFLSITHNHIFKILNQWPNEV